MASPAIPPAPTIYNETVLFDGRFIVSIVIVWVLIITFLFILHCFRRSRSGEYSDIERGIFRSNEVLARALAELRIPARVADSGETMASLKEMKMEKMICSGEECSICLEEFEEEDICGVIESCGHCFHKDCIDQWLKIVSRCPLCRCFVRHGNQA